MYSFISWLWKHHSIIFMCLCTDSSDQKHLSVLFTFTVCNLNSYCFSWSHVGFRHWFPAITVQNHYDLSPTKQVWVRSQFRSWSHRFYFFFLWYVVQTLIPQRPSQLQQFRCLCCFFCFVIFVESQYPHSELLHSLQLKDNQSFSRCRCWAENNV